MKSYRICSTALHVVAAFIVIAAHVPSRVNAQAAGGNTTINTTSAGYLGILQLRCDCTLRLDQEERFRYFRFRNDPVITSIEAGSPAHGRLEIGDVVTHVDGASIRTTTGAQKFANIQPGQSIELTVSRDGRSSNVRLTATGTSWSDSRVLGSRTPTVASRTPGVVAFSFPSAPRASRIGAEPAEPPEPVVPAEPPANPPVPPAAPSAPVAPVPPVSWGVINSSGTVVPFSSVTPSGWFGFSFRCTGCGWAISSRTGSAPVWESGDAPPELSLIAPDGPAAKAGLRAGDVMTHIDGFSITSREGARKLGAVQPGQKVRVTVTRDGRPLVRELTLGRRPGAAVVVAPAPRSAPATPAPRAARELRYTGKLDGVSVEVWSPAASRVERVGDTMIITIGTSVIRLKVDPRQP